LATDARQGITNLGERREMQSAQVIWMLTLALTLTGALLDWRSRRLPNWLTIPGLLLGVIVHTTMTGWHGTLFAVGGAAAAMLLLLTPVLMRLLGAGDWKLVGAVGAFLGPVLILFVLFGAILASGVMALVQMIYAHRVLETFRNMKVLVRGFFAFGLKPNPEMSLDNPALMKVPFGVAVAAATVICYCASRLVM
jgi:prepilin peptidase CpaA